MILFNNINECNIVFLFYTYYYYYYYYFIVKNIKDFDLVLYDTNKSTLGGLNDEFICNY